MKTGRFVAILVPVDPLPLEDMAVVALQAPRMVAALLGEPVLRMDGPSAGSSALEELPDRDRQVAWQLRYCSFSRAGPHPVGDPAFEAKLRQR